MVEQTTHCIIKVNMCTEKNRTLHIKELACAQRTDMIKRVCSGERVRTQVGEAETVEICIAQIYLTRLIFVPLLPKCSDCKHVSPRPAQLMTL